MAARNERESVQVALRPKVTWGGCGVAGIVQVQCNDLVSASGDRLVPVVHHVYSNICFSFRGGVAGVNSFFYLLKEIHRAVEWSECF